MTALFAPLPLPQPSFFADGEDGQQLTQASAVKMIEGQCKLLLSRPTVYQCPITHDLFKDPVVVADGHTYERHAILEHFRTNSKRSPMTNEPLAHDHLTENHFCKMAVHEYRDSVLRGISEILPYVDELGDPEKVELLLARAQEIAATPEAGRKVRADWLRRQLGRATAGNYEVAGVHLTDLAVLDPELASAAMSEMRNDVVMMMCANLPGDAPGSVLTSHERLRRVMDHALSAFLELLRDDDVDVKGSCMLTCALNAAADGVRAGLSSMEDKTGMVVFSEIDTLFPDTEKEATAAAASAASRRVVNTASSSRMERERARRATLPRGRRRPSATPPEPSEATADAVAMQRRRSLRGPRQAARRDSEDGVSASTGSSPHWARNVLEALGVEDGFGAPQDWAAPREESDRGPDEEADLGRPQIDVEETSQLILDSLPNDVEFAIHSDEEPMAIW